MAPSSAAAKSRRTCSIPFQERADLPNTPPLSAYIFELMVNKKSNLCLSADVRSTAELLQVTEECGDSICILKTHADIVSDFGERTIKRLVDIASRKNFLIFEDRKFGDIGSTVQAQYSGGPHRIADWAYITNAHIFPGPDIITSLKAAANAAITASSSTTFTQITAGRSTDSPPAMTGSDSSSGTASAGKIPASKAHAGPNDDDIDNDDDGDDEEDDGPDVEDDDILNSRKSSVVSISTTISSSTEYISPPASSRQSSRHPSFQGASPTPLYDPPSARGLLLLAQMSSAGNLFTSEYTRTCLQMAREHSDFVIGFIAQEDLNASPGDNFLTMTPGVSLPALPRSSPSVSGSSSSSKSKGKDKATSNPSSKNDKLKGDGQGQQYNTPRHIILQKGCDVAIVGRGILNAVDRRREAERYRKEAWAAYQERVGETTPSSRK